MADEFDKKKKIGEIKTELEITETVSNPKVEIEVLDETVSTTNISGEVVSSSPVNDVVIEHEEPTAGNVITYDSDSVPGEDYIADSSNVSPSDAISADETVPSGVSSNDGDNVSTGSSDNTPSSSDAADYVDNGYNPNATDSSDENNSAGEPVDSPNKNKEEPTAEDENASDAKNGLAEENKNPKPEDMKDGTGDGQEPPKDANPKMTGENPESDKSNQDNGEGGLPKKDALDDKDADKNPDARGYEKKNPEDPDKNPNTQGKNIAQQPESSTKPNNTAGTDAANRNLNHNKRMQEGKKAEESGTKKKGKDSDNKESKSSTQKSDSKDKKKKSDKKAKGKAKSKNKIGKALDVGNKIKHPFRSLFNFLKNKLWLWLLAHPTVLVAIGIFVVLLLLVLAMFVLDGGSGSGANGQSGTRCNYELNGVLSTGTLSANGLKVELVNCSATESNYTVLETVELEKYVLGVALAEIGPSASPEALKAQIVAARNFTLTRNSGMCPGNPDNCFFGYNPNSGKIRMRACENDQVYWDYEKNIYRQDQGAVSLYSPEINSGTLWKSALTAEKKAEVLKIAEDVKGVVLLDEAGNVVKTPYNSTVSTTFNELAGAGKTYKEILSVQYGVSNYNDASCSYDGELFYGDYVLTSDGTSILTERLDMFLNNRGSSIESLGTQISENVSTAGYGTRAGVVAAAVTLIGELGNNYGVKVPYYWGGGHYDGVVIGPLGYWGSTECHTYANDQHYNYCGFDCSGFVPWAIKNGGFNMSQKLAGDFQNIAGAERITLKSNLAVLQPGDLLESSGHIVLVIGVDEEMKQYICAEAAGNQYGVLFTRRSFNEGGYWGVRMDGFYNNPSNIRGA